jgi:hypothetical protein
VRVDTCLQLRRSSGLDVCICLFSSGSCFSSFVGGSPSTLMCTAPAFDRSFAVHASAGGSGAVNTVDMDDKEYEEEDEDGTGDGAAAVAETLIAEATGGGGEEEK